MGYIVAAVVGLLVGGVVVWVLNRRNIEMYVDLYDNERNGNFLLLKKLEELKKLGDDDVE